MERNRGGRKRLGEEKRTYEVKIRFNKQELKIVRDIVASYNLDIRKRGVLSPFLRRLLLNKEAIEAEKLPELSINLVYQINKIGTNINQLTTVAKSKNLRNPSAKLDAEIEKSNELLSQILELLHENITK